MEFQQCVYKLGQINMTAELLRNMIRGLEESKQDDFKVIFELMDMLVEASEI